MKKIYLDEFVNIAVHHLVRGNSKNLFQFIWSKNFIRSFALALDEGRVASLALSIDKVNPCHKKRKTSEKGKGNENAKGLKR